MGKELFISVYENKMDSKTASGMERNMAVKGPWRTIKKKWKLQR